MLYVQSKESLRVLRELIVELALTNAYNNVADPREHPYLAENATVEWVAILADLMEDMTIEPFTKRPQEIDALVYEELMPEAATRLEKLIPDGPEKKLLDSVFNQTCNDAGRLTQSTYHELAAWRSRLREQREMMFVTLHGSSDEARWTPLVEGT